LRRNCRSRYTFKLTNIDYLVSLDLLLTRHEF